MVATYTCNAIVFPDDNTDYLNNYTKFNEFCGIDWSFSDWLDFNMDYAYQRIFYDGDVTNRPSYSQLTYNYIKENYDDSMMGWDKSGYGVFEDCGYTYPAIGGGWNINPDGSGMKWYNSDWVQGQGVLEWLFSTTRAKRIEEDYHLYLQKIGAEDKPEGNLLDTITTLLSNLWDGFTQLVRLLTFTNIPNCPAWIVGLLNIFFIPMWIVLIIGIVPYVNDMIKTIASFIESFTPW